VFYLFTLCESVMSSVFRAHCVLFGVDHFDIVLLCLQ